MESSKAIEALGALAQETRLEAFRLLVGVGPGGLSAGEIAAELDVPAPTLSFHLKTLTQAGLLVATREGRSIRYALDVEGMRGLLDYLSRDCCQGNPELCLPVRRSGGRGAKART